MDCDLEMQVWRIVVKKRINKDVPPGTPPPTTPLICPHASNNLVCSLGSIGTSERSDITRSRARMDERERARRWRR